MLSKKFKERFKMTTFTGLTLMGIQLLLALFCYYMSTSTWEFNFTEIMDRSLFVINLLFAVIISVVMSVKSFAFLGSRKACDFYHSLPEKRFFQYANIVIADILWMLIAVGVPGIIIAVIWGIEGQSAMNVLVGTFSAFVACVYIYMVFSITIICFGNRITGIVFSVIALLMVRISVIYGCNNIYDVLGISWGFDKASGIFSDRYSCYVNLYTNILGSFNMITAKNLLSGIIITLPATVGLFFLAGHLYKVRKSEIAGNHTVIKGAAGVYRFFFLIFPVTVCNFCFVSKYIEKDEPAGIVISIFVCIVLYFLFDLIVYRNIKILKKSIVRLPAFIVISGAVIGITFAGCNYAEGRKLDDSTKYVEIYGLDNFTDNMYKEGLRIDDAQILDILKNEKPINGWVRNINIGINNGKTTFYRTIGLSDENYLELRKLMYDKKYLRLPDVSEFAYFYNAVTLNVKGLKDFYKSKEYKEHCELYKILKEEAENINLFSETGKYVNNPQYTNEELHFCPIVFKSDISDYYAIPIGKDSFPKTYEYIENKIKSGVWGGYMF